MIDRSVWYDWFRWLPSIDKGMWDSPSKVFRNAIDDIKMAKSQKTLFPTCSCGCKGQWFMLRGFRTFPLSVLQRLNPFFPSSWYKSFYKRIVAK